MSVQTQLDRINNNVQSALRTIADAGVSVVANANSDDLPAAAAALANELNIDYDVLAFDVTEIIIETSTTSILGQAILGRIILV